MASKYLGCVAADGLQGLVRRYPLALLTLVMAFFTFITNAQQQQQPQDKLTPGQPINDTGFLVSASAAFRLGFFSPGSSKNLYLGIWYNKVPGNKTVVWVANRDNPLPETAGGGLLSLATNGTLLLTNNNRTVTYWRSNVDMSNSINRPVARIRDTGNLEIVDEGSGSASNFTAPSIVWQSFDYPTDTLLPGMKLGQDLRRRLDWKATAWNSLDDPAPGLYTIGLDLRGVPQLILRGPRSSLRWRTGPWNGQRFSGIPEMETYNDMFDFSFVTKPDEVYYEYTTRNSHTARVVLTKSGEVERLVWNEGTGSWSRFFLGPKDQCDNMNPCGAFGVCNPNDMPICSCLQGFHPKMPQDWRLRDNSGGCIRKTSLGCGNGTDGFLEVKGAKLPDTVNATLLDKGIGLEQCKAECLKNCSCTAYAAADIAGPVSGCIVWTGDLTDVRIYANGGQNLYIRLAAADLAEDEKGEKRKAVKLVIILVFLLLGAGLIGCIGWTKLRRNSKRKNVQDSEIPQGTISITEDVESDRQSEFELPLLELSTLLAATNYFSNLNKLGEGGFGPVYKGRLADGQYVAIKRLSRNSAQGNDEFKNEVRLIAKLQHRNLVRLLGCCIQGEERMLVYEYMPNKSLDALLFGNEKSSQLNWNIRYQIIIGIARGILYLHQDSRFRIIHRDLKASNILLDKDLTPKISDFGMARIFDGDKTEANTKKVVGTYGYMSPEYAMDGIFSIKSDVFSFGVLVLEIISGIRNKGIFHSEPRHNLLAHVWSSWNDGGVLEVVDSSISDSVSMFEVLRCIHIGLLCVQEHPVDRPTMSSIIFMLESDASLLPQPKQPGFTMTRDLVEMQSLSGRQDSSEACDTTVTILDGR